MLKNKKLGIHARPRITKHFTAFDKVVSHESGEWNQNNQLMVMSYKDLMLCIGKHFGKCII